MAKSKKSQKLYNTGFEYEVNGDTIKAFNYYKKSAALGNAKGQFKLGWLYSFGIGVECDYKLSFKYYTQSAKQGYLDSYCNLASMLLNGNGVERNEKKALKLLTYAAENGHVGAQCNLGALLFGETDLTEGVKWLNLAASDNSCVASYAAQYKLGCYYESLSQGLFVKPYLEALKWYDMAADNGNLEAKQRLDEIRNK